MKLIHLLTETVTTTLDSPDQFKCEFTVGELTYEFHAYKDTLEYSDPGISWDITFGLVEKPGSLNYQTTKTGKAFTVFSTVKSCIMILLQKHPEIVQLVFTADKNEQSRVSLYTMFANRALPGWKGEVEPGGFRDFFKWQKVT